LHRRSAATYEKKCKERNTIKAQEKKYRALISEYLNGDKTEKAA
jgi:hypothetical protein